MTAHFSGHQRIWMVGQHPLHERMPGFGHHWSTTCSNDGFLNVHRALDIVDEQVFSILSANNIVSQQRNQAVRIDEGASLIDSTQSVAVTIGTKSEFTAMLNNSVAQVNHVLWPCWIGTVVWFAGVPITVQINVINTHLVEQLRHRRAWDSVATIHSHLDWAGNRSSRFDDGVNVGVQVRCVTNRAFTNSEFSSQEDLFQFLNLFTSEWQGSTAHLESVMGWHRQVTCRHHYATVDRQSPACVVDATCGNDAQIMHFNTALDKPSNQFTGERGGRITNVSPNSKSIATKVGGHRPSKSVGECRSQFPRAVTVCKTANVVGFEALNRPLVHASWIGLTLSRVPMGFNDG